MNNVQSGGGQTLPGPNSPNVYDGAIGQFKSMCTFFKFEDAGIVTAKADEQKTEATREKILELVKKL